MWPALLERVALRDWRAITALFAASTLLESLAIGHLTAFTPLFLRDELHLPASDIGPWTRAAHRLDVRGRVSARAAVGLTRPVAIATWVRSLPVALTGTVLYAHLAQVVRREERAPVMSLTPVPRNFVQFSLPLLASAAANVTTAGALLVGATAYALAAWIGWLLKRTTPPLDDQLSR